jgi:anti-sigma-K factor RskA
VSNADPFRELVESYALGALDPDECAGFEAHLAGGCAECAKAVEEARSVVSQLAYLAPEAEPSGMLRGRLVETVRFEAARDRVRSPRPKAIPLWMWGAVAAAVLFALYNAWDASRLARVIDEKQEEIARKIGELRSVQQELALARQERILADPSSVRIAMPAGRKDLPALEARWHRSLGIVVTGHGLPAPPSRRTLQLWLIPKAAGAQPLPSLTLRPDAQGRFTLLVQNPPDSPGSTKALAITEEPEGGSPQPTSVPIWVGAVAGK